MVEASVVGYEFSFSLEYAMERARFVLLLLSYLSHLLFVGWRKNQEWFNDMIDACVSQSGISCGIYSSADEWGYTLGSKSYSYAPATKLPLWFKQDDGVEDFSGFVPFGGFTSPVAKQFRSSYSLCGTSTTIGENWAPEW